MESWLPWLVASPRLLTDTLPGTARVVLVEPRRMRDRADDLLAEEDDLAKALASTWQRDPSLPFPRLHAEPDRLLAAAQDKHLDSAALAGKIAQLGEAFVDANGRIRHWTYESRGLLETTLVLMLGEFGRGPVINKNGGRDHWTNCMSMLMAGGGDDFQVAPDGWALRTVDGSRASHAEHTVAITGDGPRILTLP